MDEQSSNSSTNEGPTTTVENKYIIQDTEVVGKGAWSVVKRCTPIPPYVPPGSHPDMKFVVKVIRKKYLISLAKGDVDRAMAEVKREIDVLRHIPAHKNIVTFIEHVEQPDHFLLFFEEVRHGDLCELILNSPEGRLSEEKSKGYIYQIIKAVLHCHLHDVIHRDIKPENMLVSDDDSIKLTDFGLAKRSKGVCTGDEPMDPLALTALMMPHAGCERLLGKCVVCTDQLGTPRYVAPEMLYANLTKTHYDGFGADAWAVGVVAYIMLSGKFPFGSWPAASDQDRFQLIMDTPLAPPDEASPLALDFVSRLLNKDPSKRTTLYMTLQHPWLADVVPVRRSVVAQQIRQGGNVSAEVEAACKRFDEEAHQLHRCIAQLGHENARLRDERDKALEKKYSAHSNSLSTPRRAQTPTGTSSARLPGSSPLRTTGVRPRTASQDAGRGSLPRRTTGSSTYSSNVANRTKSPLTRTSANTTLRRGTPARTTDGLTTPIRGTTPSRVTTRTPASSSRSTGGTYGGRAASPLTGTRAATPTAASTRSTLGARGSTPNRSTGTSSSLRSRTPTIAAHVSSPSDFHVNDQVTYKGHRAVVRFNGPTTFGAGIWLGLEMMEGNEGTNDGSSFIDKKHYFTCPKGKGVFVRASQVKRFG